MGRIGVAICYDRHFEGVMATLAAGGAQMVFSPAVTFGKKSERLWRKEFATDAARQQHLHCREQSQWGRATLEHPLLRRQPRRRPRRRPSRTCPKRRDLVVAELDLDALKASDTAGWRLQGDRRPDLFK